MTVTPYGVWFTDSVQPRLYFLPRGVPGNLRNLELSGPAAGASGVFHLNGITSTPSGGTLLVAPAGKLCTIDPVTGTSKLVEGVEVPGADGLVLDGRRLWVVEAFTGQGFANRVSRWQLSADLSRGTADGVITDPAFGVPVTAAKFGNRLAVVNSHLDTGYPPVSRRTRSSWSAPDMAWLRALAVAAVIIGIAVTLHVSRRSPDERPVSRAEAEAVLDKAVRLAQAGEYTELCESVATTTGMCRFLLRSAEDMHRTPGDQAPVVVSSSYIEKTNTHVLHLRGVTGENIPYTADFAVVRDRPKGLRAYTVVYWSGVRYDA